jgi:hypothetical protein
MAALLDDPERRARMGAAGRRRVQELFSWRAVAAKVAAAYEEVIADYRDEQSRTLQSRTLQSRKKQDRNEQDRNKQGRQKQKEQARADR